MNPKAMADLFHRNSELQLESATAIPRIPPSAMTVVLVGSGLGTDCDCNHN